MGLTCTADFDQVKELLTRTLLQQFPLSVVPDLLLKMSELPLAGLILADSLEEKWNVYKNLLNFNQMRRMLHNLSELTHHSTMVSEYLIGKMRKPFQITDLLTAKFGENEIGTSMLTREIQHARDQARSWSKRHKTRFICFLRKFYHKTPGHECQEVL